jgi:hypothetical protein
VADKQIRRGPGTGQGCGLNKLDGAGEAFLGSDGFEVFDLPGFGCSTNPCKRRLNIPQMCRVNFHQVI